MGWSFVLTDLAGTQISEITNASQRKVSLPLMRVPSATFTIPLYHNLASTLLSQDTLIKAYRKDPNTGANTLAFHGPVVSVEEVGQDLNQTMNVTAAGPFWRLTKRIIPGSDARLTGITFGPADLGAVAQSILSACNGLTNGFTGIWPGTLTNSITGTAGPYYLKNAAEAITELAQGVSSFEFAINPTEPINRASAWPQIATLDCAPIIGTTKPDVIFEYGTSRANVESYNHQVTRDNLLTRAYISVQGWPDSVNKDPADPNIVLNDLIVRDSSVESTAGVFDEVVDDGGVIDNTLRTQIADYHLQIRKQPRQLVTFVPAVNAKPSPLTDFIVGDQIRARALVRGSVRFDAMFRVYGMNFEIDEEGNERTSLDLVLP